MFFAPAPPALGLPSELRNDPVRRRQAEGSLAAPEKLSATSPPITIKITSVAPLRLAAIRNVGDYAELNHGFARLVDQVAEKVGPEEIFGLYGIPHDDPRNVEPQNCRFDCAVSTRFAIEADSDIFLVDYNGGRAVQLTHHGDYDRVHDLVDALYLEAIKDDLQLSEAPLLIHYLHDPEEVATDELVSHVFLQLDADE